MAFSGIPVPPKPHSSSEESKVDHVFSFALRTKGSSVPILNKEEEGKSANYSSVTRSDGSLQPTKQCLFEGDGDQTQSPCETCDLQLVSQPQQEVMKNSLGLEGDLLESSFDDNGNFFGLGEQLGKEVNEKEENGETEKEDENEIEDDQPKYFINAKALDESGEGLIYSLPVIEDHFVTNEEIKNESKAEKVFEKRMCRVPVSKSFPDIIQTTFESESKERQSVEMKELISKDNSSDLDSILAADSLEELTSLESTESQNKTLMTDKLFQRSFDMSMSQSVGIVAEKPPEAWIIDLNSLSQDESLTCDQRRNAGSNPNSLAFFINMEEGEEKLLDLEKKNSLDKKKIFSMFVDLEQNRSGSEEGRSTSRIQNKTLMNISTDSISLGKKHPSPIFQHKAAAETARKNAIIGLNKGCGKPTMKRDPDLTGDIEKKENNKKMMEIPSNRSSLHVPNIDMENSLLSSSILTSMELSGQTEEVCQKGPCFKLGKDLLRMFQEGINTDVNIGVNGRHVKAHKCILASRSQYFAALLSGHWVEKAGNTINLDGFSFNVVQFTLYHIYSGTNEIPDSIDLFELANLCDLLGLEGLRENIAQTIRVKFCHNFHRPCTSCISGVLECFPIASSYGMDDLNRKMTKWVCKNFVRVWPTKAYVNLGDEFMEKCLRYSVNHLSVDNILDVILGCEQLLSTMPTVRWTEPIFSVVNQLNDSCVLFLGENLSTVVQGVRFLQFGKGQTWSISRIHDTFAEALLILKPDEACLSHVALTRIIELGTHTLDEVEWSTTFVDFVKLLCHEVERFLISNASRAVISKNWESLSQDCRRRICSSSFMGFDKSVKKVAKISTGKQDKTKISKLHIAASPVPSRNSSSRINTNFSGTPNQLSDTNKKFSTSSTPKVTSIRPVQNVLSTLPSSSPTLTKSPEISSTRNFTSQHVNKAQTPSVLPRVASLSKTRQSLEKKMPKDKLLKESPRASLTSAPKKPLTPLTPNKLIGTISSTPRRGFSYREREKSNLTPVPQPCTPTTIKPTFKTNSEKANLVSKPLFRQKDEIRTPSLQPEQKTRPTKAVLQPAVSGKLSGSNTLKNSIPSSSSGKSISKKNIKIGNNQSSSGQNLRQQGEQNGIRKDKREDLNVMSRSTIEEGSEMTMRTLAEIGRSSTFSKDEPTIIGKFDIHIENNADYILN